MKNNGLFILIIIVLLQYLVSCNSSPSGIKWVIQPTLEYDRVGPFNKQGLAKVFKDITRDYTRVGLINREGKEICPPKYFWITDFQQNGYAKVSIQGKIGVINASGKEICPLKYWHIKDFQQPESVAWAGHNQKWILIDTTGKEIYSADRLKKVENKEGVFTNGIASVSKDRKWGFINSDGKEICEVKYQDVSNFSEDLGGVKKDGKWGFIDKQGNETIPSIYERIYPFHNGLAVVCQNDKWGVIDKKGKEVFPFEWDHCDDLKEGLYSLFTDDNQGLLNVETSKIYPLDPYSEFLIDGDFKNGFAVFYRRGIKYEHNYRNFGVINNLGKEVFFGYDGINIPYNPFSEEDKQPDVFWARRDGKFGLVDKNGKQITPFEYFENYSASFFVEGMAKLNKPKVWFIDSKGKEIIAKEFYKILHNFKNGVAWFQTDGGIIIYDLKTKKSPMKKGKSNFGFVDKNGEKTFLDPGIKAYIEWDDYEEDNNGYKDNGYYFDSRFREGLAIVSSNIQNEETKQWEEKFGYIDKTGKVVIPIQYEQVRIASEGLLIVKYEGKWGAIKNPLQ